jgi:hypothetical protein
MWDANKCKTAGERTAIAPRKDLPNPPPIDAALLAVGALEVTLSVHPNSICKSSWGA